MKQTILSSDAMQNLGVSLAKTLKGGELIELIGDVGAGKTTFVKGIAAGLGVKEVVQSPSFTIFARYDASGNRSLHHYDFYRLTDPGLTVYDLEESLQDPLAITVIEWADTVSDMLPAQHITLRIKSSSETEREVEMEGYPA